MLLCLRIKSLRKKELMLSALPDFIQRSITINARQEMESFENICRLIKDGKTFSTWVDKRWKEMALQAQTYTFCERIDDEHWEVFKSTSVRCIVHSVYIPAVPKDGDDVPTCSCPEFTSSWLPCAAMCKAFGDVERPMFDQCNLKWRWRLCSHPLFEREARKLIPGSDFTADVDYNNNGRANVDPEVVDIGATMQAYASMKVPASSHTRYKALMDVAKALVAEGSIDAASYKSALFDLIAAQNKLKNLALVSLDDEGSRPPSAIQPVPIRPPLTRHTVKGRKRVSTDELLNKGGLYGQNKKKKALTSSNSIRRTVRCSVCQALNRDGRGHRKGSQKCPTVISYHSEEKAHAKEAFEKQQQQLNEARMQPSKKHLQQHLDENRMQSSAQQQQQHDLDETHMQPCEQQKQDQPRKKRQHRCSLCRKNGVIATNHRKGSKCPFFQMPKSAKPVDSSQSDSSSSQSDSSDDSTIDSIPLVQLARIATSS